jgi:hypothetical protein
MAPERQVVPRAELAIRKGSTMKAMVMQSILCAAISFAGVHTAQARDAGALLGTLSRESGIELFPLQQHPPVKNPASALLFVSERDLDLRKGAEMLQLVRDGRPVLVMLSEENPAPGQGLLAVIGVRPRAAFVVLTAGPQEGLEINVFQQLDHQSASAAIAALVEHAAQSGAVMAGAAHVQADSGQTLAPQLRRVVNMVGMDGQMDAIITLTVVRNVSRTEDVKTIVVKTRTSLRPDGAGITNGSVTGDNLWASRLPVLYTLGHALSANGGPAPLLETYLPEADGRTEFTYSRTDDRMFSIAGSLGGEFGSGATPGQALQWTAQSPFSVGASYQIGTSETLSHSFQDYSLNVTGQSPAVRWELPLAGRLGQHALVRPTAALPVFMPEALTPMMRNATMDALSVWQVPGHYDGVVTFTQEGGLTVHEDRWHYERANLVANESSIPQQDGLALDIAMGGWELAREIPVLLQSAQGAGSCMEAVGDAEVGLGVCNSSNERMMWGFDQAGRYHNLATNRCLAYNVALKTVQQQECMLVNNQYWVWRAERLHSMYNLLWRLYVTADNRVELEPDGSFVVQDQPVNQFNSLDIPWSSYPSRASAGDTMPNRNSISPEISPDWVRLYDADVTPSQLWQIQVVSRALQ